MKTKNIILIAIAILVIALLAVGIYTFTDSGNISIPNPLDNNSTTKDFINIGTINADDIKNKTNDTVNVVGDNSTFNNTSNLTNNNTTYKVYNPQTDTYVPVIGEKFDSGVNRWYTYDEDGVRYYNTRIN